MDEIKVFQTTPPEIIPCDHTAFYYLEKTAKEWHDIALVWKRRALDADIRAKTAERDADMLADRLIEDSESVMGDLAVDLRPDSADGPFR